MCITSYIFCTLCNAVSWVYMLKRASRILVAKIPWHSLGFGTSNWVAGCVTFCQSMRFLGMNFSHCMWEVDITSFD